MKAMEHDVQGDKGMSRRRCLELVAGAAVWAGASSCATGPPAKAPTPSRLADDLCFSSASAMAQAIRTKQISAVDAVEACLKRIETVNPTLNAVVQLRAEEARRGAQAADATVAAGGHVGPLHGVPMTIKDSLDTAGVVSTGGTKGRADFVPSSDATVVARLKAAGAILLGKTNTPELTLSYETDNLIYGRTRNPYDPDRTPGGSSGGAAAIVASGGSAFDIGSDYGGSIRFPSHCCGIAGIKPTSGRVPRTGHIFPFGGPLDSMQQLGPMARYVEDLDLLLPILAGPDGVDFAIAPMPLESSTTVDLSGLRIAFHTDNGILAPTPEVSASVRSAADALSSRVRLVEEKRPTGIEQSLELITSLWNADGGAATRRLLREAGTAEHSFPWLDAVTAPAPAEVDALHARWDRFRTGMLQFFRDYDVILSPVNAYPAMPHGSYSEGMEPFSYTMTHNLTGWPGVVVRCGTSPENLPIGVQIVSHPWREHVALAVAAHLESELGGFQPPPGI